MPAPCAKVHEGLESTCAWDFIPATSKEEVTIFPASLSISPHEWLPLPALERSLFRGPSPISLRGPELEFENRGGHGLKGIRDPWTLFAMENSSICQRPVLTGESEPGRSSPRSVRVRGSAKARHN